jgi:hypothetical protein
VKGVAKASEGQNVTRRGCTEPRTAVVEGFKVAEHLFRSENRVKSGLDPLHFATFEHFLGWGEVNWAPKTERAGINMGPIGAMNRRGQTV